MNEDIFFVHGFVDDRALEPDVVMSDVCSISGNRKNRMR